MHMASDIDDLFPPSEGWAESSVTIKLPPPNTRFKLKREEDVPTVTIDGIHHRSLLEGITRAFTQKSFFDFHLKGFQLWWKPSDGEAQRVHCEVYNSETFLEMEEQIPPLSAQDIQGGVQESVVAQSCYIRMLLTLQTLVQPCSGQYTCILACYHSTSGPRNPHLQHSILPISHQSV